MTGFFFNVFAIAFLQRAPIAAISQNVPDSQSFSYRGKHYHLLK